MATIYTSVGETVVVDLIDGTSSTHLDATNAKVGWGTGAGGRTAVGSGCGFPPRAGSWHRCSGRWKTC